MILQKRQIGKLLAFVFLLSLYFVLNEDNRTNFSSIIFFYTISFIVFLALVVSRFLSFREMIWLAILSQLLTCFFQPSLSNDYYRFLWDGELFWNGINPYDYTPNEISEMNSYQTNYYLQDLYNNLSSLSQRNYSCYPTVNQFYFIIGSAFSSSIVFNAIILKLTIILTQIIGAVYLIKLLAIFKLNANRIWLLFLNPLWIIESTGNLHFEAVMMSFLFIAFYYVFNKKLGVAGLLFGISVQIKLIPLLLLPFFFRLLGFFKASYFYLIVFIVSIGFQFVFMNNLNYENFIASLRLYFKAFEFNSFLLHHVVEYGKYQYGWNLAQRYAPILAQISIFIILSLALYGNAVKWEVIFKRMTLAFFFYLLFSSTIHPWYIIPLLSLSLFTNYTFPIVWSFAIMLSYYFYRDLNNQDFYYRLLVNLEYGIVLVVFLFEVFSKKTLIKKLNLKHYLIQTEPSS